MGKAEKLPSKTNIVILNIGKIVKYNNIFALLLALN